MAAKPVPAARPAAPSKGATITELKPDGAQPPKKGPKLKWMLLVLLLLGAAGGGAAWYFTRPVPTGEPSKSATPRAPVFLNLEPFTVNLLEENGDHYLQIGIVYQMADDKAVDQAKVYMPVLRNRILLLLSSKRPSDLATPEGKSKLVAELVAAARESIPSGPPEHGVVGAYLSAFVVQ